MADSSSESEATFDIEEVPEDNRDHVREVLAKGKQIIPYYSDYALYQLYKRYYQADNVFYNQLQMIINHRKEQDSGEGWITVGNTKRQTKKQKYNFLQDKQLIWRATNWDKEEAKQRHNRNKNPRENVPKNNNSSQAPPKYREKNSSQSNNFKNEKKQAYEEKKKKFQQKSKDISKEESGNKQKYAQKTEKKVNKESVKESVPQESKVPLKQQKKAPIKYAEKPAKNESKNASNSQKYQQKIQQAEKPKPEVKEEIKKQEPKKEPAVAKEKQQVPAAPEKKSEPVQKSAPKQATKTTLDKSDIDRNFMESMKKYPKILKFIKPEAKIQKISYISNSGSIDNVRVHVPLNQ